MLEELLVEHQELYLTMPEITKANLPEFVKFALTRSGIDPQISPQLALAIVQSRSIEFSTPIQRPNDFMEMIVVGKSSRQAIRTSGNQVNVFAFASVLLSAGFPSATAVSAATIFVALLGACTISLTPEQAAFFLAAERLRDTNTIPTVNALAQQIGTQLQRHNYSSQDVLSLVQQLKHLGVPINIGEAPNNVIRHSEWTVSIPGF